MTARAEPSHHSMTEFPSKPGRYEVVWKGWHTFLPVFMEFDGEKWVDLDTKAANYPHFDESRRERLPGIFIWFDKD